MIRTGMIVTAGFMAAVLALAREPRTPRTR
jgi:hypothetical protein